LIGTGYGAYCTPTMAINLDTWNSLPSDLQAIFEKWNKEIDEWTSFLRTQEEHDVVNKMMEAGMEVQPWPDADMEKAKQIVQPAQMEQWVENNHEKVGISVEEYTEFMQTYINYLNEFEDPNWESGIEHYKKELK